MDGISCIEKRKKHSWVCIRLFNQLLQMSMLVSKIIEQVGYKTEKLLIQILIREIINDLIKPPSEGDFSGARSESGDAIIGDTSLRKCMPPRQKNW